MLSGSRGVLVALAWSGERCDPLARSGSGSGRGSPRRCGTRVPAGGGRRAGGGRELGGSAAGGDLRGGDTAGGVQGVEGMIDLAGGLVVVEGLADLAAGQSAGMRAEGGVDLFGERIAGRAGQRPGGGSGGVVMQRERGGQVLGADLWLAVGEGVEEREPDDVRLGSGGD